MSESERSESKRDEQEQGQLFYIRDARQVVGNCALWWRVGGAGYTTELREAGRFPRAKAFNLRETDVAYECSKVDSIAVTHVRVEGLHGLESSPLPRRRDESQDRVEIRRLVESFFVSQGRPDPKFLMQRWMRSKNPLLGDISPKDMIALGKVGRLLNFVRQQISENEPHLS